jgi:hypothetical protein
MRELVQQTTSGSTELAASAEQMSKMSRDLLESMNRFGIGSESEGVGGEKNRGTARAAAASRA